MASPRIVPPQEVLQLSGVRLGQPPPIIRFEVTDATSAQFVPNASVSLIFEDGTHILTKLTDAGGNVAFREREIQEAVEQAGLRGAEGVFWYTVEAPGYQMAEAIVWDPDVPGSEQVRKIYEVTLHPAAPSAKADAYLVAGVTAAALLAVALV